MSQSNRIVVKLRELVAFLRAHDESGWADGFERMANQFPFDPDDTRAKIKGCYAGMGSFNDFILHKNRIPLCDENDELDRLKEELWQLCENG